MIPYKYSSAAAAAAAAAAALPSLIWTTLSKKSASYLVPTVERTDAPSIFFNSNTFNQSL
jgi:hypothetical protein